MTHMRIDDAMIAMIPMEKIPISASRFVIGTRRLSSAGMGRSMMIISVNRLAADEKTQSGTGSKHLTFGRLVFGLRSNCARYPASDQESEGFWHWKTDATVAAKVYMQTNAMVAFT
jgi:hypothetical protein